MTSLLEQTRRRITTASVLAPCPARFYKVSHDFVALLSSYIKVLNVQGCHPERMRRIHQKTSTKRNNLVIVSECEGSMGEAPTVGAIAYK